MAFIEHQHVIDKVAFINGLVSGVALYPQIWIVLVQGSGSSVSGLSFSLIFLNSIVWILYSVHRSLFTLAVTSTLNCIASGILVVISFLS